MIVGVPKEIKSQEYRVGLVPAGARHLIQSGAQVVVQAGAGIGSGIEDAEDEDIDTSIVEGSPSKWEVRHHSGNVSSYDYFLEVRKAVLEGKIVPGETIISFDGVEQDIEDYPGTADLFGNQYSKEDIGLKQIPEWKPTNRRRKRDYETFVYLVLVIGACIGAFFAYPNVMEYLRTKQGESFVLALGEQPSKDSTPIPRIEVFRLWTEKALHDPDIIELETLKKQLTRALGKDIHNIELMSLLSQVYTDMGHLQRSRELLTVGEQLAMYAKFLKPNSPEFYISYARYLWRSEKYAKAISLLSSQTNLGTSGASLLGNIYADQGDFQKAIISFSEAYEKQPRNIYNLLNLVRIYERQNKFDEATAFLKKARALDPRNELLKKRQLSFYKTSKDYASLEDYYQNELRKKEDQDINLYELILIFEKQKDYDSVAKYGSRFLANYPNHEKKPEIEALHKNALEALAPAPKTENKTGRKSDTPRRYRRRRR